MDHDDVQKIVDAIQTLALSNHKIAGAINNIADSGNKISRSIDLLTHRVGTGNAATDMGAIEYLGSVIETGFSGISSSIDNMSNSIDHINYGPVKQ